MKWADFETERASLRQNVAAIKLSANNVKHPQGSSRDQVGVIANKKSSVKSLQGELDAEISAEMERPTELNHVSLSWDMPAVPPMSKKILEVHNEKLSKIEKLRDTFSQDFRLRKDFISKSSAILDP